MGETRLGDGSTKVDFETVCGIITSWYSNMKPAVLVPQRRSNSISAIVVIHNSSNFFEAKLCKAIIEFEKLMK